MQSLLNTIILNCGTGNCVVTLTISLISSALYPNVTTCYVRVFAVATFLFLLHQSGILYLHMFALLTISVHLSVILNHTFSSQLSLPSYSVPAPPIRFSRFWRSINLVVCMYVYANPTVACLSSATFARPTQGVDTFDNISLPFCTLTIF